MGLLAKANVGKVIGFVRAELLPDLTSEKAGWAARQRYQRWFRVLALALVPMLVVVGALFLNELPAAGIAFWVYAGIHSICLLYVGFRLISLPCPSCHRDFVRFHMDPLAQVCGYCGARLPPERRRRRSKPIAQGAEPPRVDPDQRLGDPPPRPRKKFF
jgi:hypothetical protein